MKRYSLLVWVTSYGENGAFGYAGEVTLPDDPVDSDIAHAMKVDDIKGAVRRTLINGIRLESFEIVDPDDFERVWARFRFLGSVT
jgi:hypothetical protein